jgi:hypothetical protein
MLQSLAKWIMSGEKQAGNESRLAEVESLLLESRPLFVSHYGEDHVATLTNGTLMAMLARARGDLARAESIREESVRRFRQVAEGDPNHIWALVYLAEAKLELGKGAEAETLFAQASAFGRRQWGANDFRLERVFKYISQARASSGKRDR